MSECNRCKLNGIESVAMDSHMKVTLAPAYKDEATSASGTSKRGMAVLVCLAFETPEQKKHVVFWMKTLDKYCSCGDRDKEEEYASH